jgi:hypothetical protein
MTRHAVEDFRGPAPVIEDPNDDAHPFNKGVVFASVGSLTVYCHNDSPGQYWLDLYKKKPASEAQAVAAFGSETVNKHRRQAVELADDQRIEQALSAQQEPSPQELAKEDLKAKARRLSREYAKQVQAQADKQLTGWLDNERPQG